MTGLELRELRLRMGLKPRELADLIGLSRNSLYRLEGGHRRISRTIALFALRLASQQPTENLK